MAIILERYSKFFAPLQGLELTGLVEQESHDVRDIFPGTVERYSSVPRAIKNVWRIATDRGIDAFLLKQKSFGPMLGVGTIISGDHMVHPDSAIGVIEGSDLDYWMVDGVDESLHADVARALVQKNAELVEGRFADSDSEQPVTFNFSVPARQGRAHNRGLIPLGEPVGLGPVSVTSQISGDPYGVARDGQPVQVYAGNINL